MFTKDIAGEKIENTEISEFSKPHFDQIVKRGVVSRSHDFQFNVSCELQY